MEYLIIKSIYFLIPVGLANMAPIFARFFFKKKICLDFGKRIFGKRIFGENKTVYGFLLGILFSILGVFIQKLLYNFDFFISISIVDFKEINVFAFGALIGFGALFGDAVKSFLKRRIDIKEGKSFFPLDQIDYVLGAFLFIGLFYREYFSWELFFGCLIVGLILHLFVSYLGYILGLKASKI